MTLAAVVTWIRNGNVKAGKNGCNGRTAINPCLEEAYARLERAHEENARVRRELVGTAVIAREESARAHQLAMAVLECECEEEEEAEHKPEVADEKA